ncbi:hypothetical protein OG440_34465 [Streptomyces sp. NBC_00637]
MLLVTFVLAVRKGVHRLVDVAWGVAFTDSAVSALVAPSPRS